MTSETPEPSKKSRFSKKIVLILLSSAVLLVFIIVLAFVFLQWRSKAQLPVQVGEQSSVNILRPQTDLEPHTDKETPPPTKVASLDAPELFSGLDWTEPERVDSYSGGFVYVTETIEKNVFFNEVALSGQKWTAESLGADDSMVGEFIDYYNSMLAEKGWENRVYFENYYFQGIAGDAPNGSIWGLVGLSKDSVRTIVTGYSTKGDGGVEYELFVSDIVSSSEIIDMASD